MGSDLNFGFYRSFGTLKSRLLSAGREPPLEESRQFGLHQYVSLWALVRLTRARNLQAAIAYVLQAPPRDFFDFPSTHATSATVFSVFDSVSRSLLRGPLGEALVDMREKTEETKSGRKLWTRGPPRRTLWCVHRYIFLIVFLMNKFAPFPRRSLSRKSHEHARTRRRPRSVLPCVPGGCDHPR